MEHIILVCLIFFSSSFIRSCFGFGDALIAMPLLSLFLPPETVTPLVAMVAISISASIIISNFRKVDYKSSKTLIISAIIGIPIGIYALQNFNEKWVKLILAILIIVFALFKLFYKSPLRLSFKWGYVFGFLGGILGGAYNMNGPPAVVFASMHGWSKEEFRINMQAYFLFTGGFIFLSHGISGLWTQDVFIHYLYSIPLVFLAIYLGKLANRKMNPLRFEKIIYSGLLIIGLSLFLKTFSSL